MPASSRILRTDGDPSRLTRRQFIGAATVSTLGVVARARPAIRVEHVACACEDFRYRAPLKFGGTVVDRVTLLNVTCLVRTADGRSATGFGSMPLGNVWAFPSKAMPYDRTLGAMKALSARIAALTSSCTEQGHPIDLNRQLEPAYLAAAADVSRELGLAEPIPTLATLVVASPFDAALHDAYGKAHGLNCYRTYGRDHLPHDLDRYLGAEFRGDHLGRHVVTTPRPRLPLYHLVGAVDPILEADIGRRLNDGLPETLPEWIAHDGLTHLKVKLNGDDLGWDVERVVRVDRVASETRRRGRAVQWSYSLDFNERCRDVEYLLEFLRTVREKTPAGFDRIQYVEQPTSRDLRAQPTNVMHAAAKLRPVVIDESLTGLESLLLAREMGYSGVALKACKGQSQSLLMAAAARRFGMFLCVQDLTCPGASLIQSAGLAAHVKGVAAIEANARQYVPAANAPWQARFPGVFRVTDGALDTSALTGPGLGAVPPGSEAR